MDDRPGPWSPATEEGGPSYAWTAVPPTAPPPPVREPAFKAPWPVLALTAAICAVFFWQLNAPDTTAVIFRHGLVPEALSAGRWPGLFSHIFLHGGWIHLFLNATALLAFGTPVARLYGSGPGGALRLLLFFLLCGVLGGLAFWVLHPAGGTPLVGASGAISGLMGGAARLIEQPGRLGRPFGRAALSFVVPWVVMNLLLAAAGLALGPAMPIAWEAHLGGLAAGLLAVGLFAPRALIRAPG